MLDEWKTSLQICLSWYGGKGRYFQRGIEGITLDEFIPHSLSGLQEEHSNYYRQLLENRVASIIRTDQSEKEYLEAKKAIERLNVDIAAQVRNLREADDALKRSIQDDIKELTDELQSAKLPCAESRTLNLKTGISSRN